MSFLQRLWQRIRRPTGYVGKDLEGNRYFEYPNPNDAWGRPKRVVKYREGYDMWTYVAGERRLPVQWTSWLTHTRVHAPSLEELLADMERQKRVRLMATLIEARDREQMAQIAASNSPTSAATTGDTASPRIEASVSQSPNDDQKAENRMQGPGASPIMLKEAPQPTPRQHPNSRPATSDEPQAWTPRAAVRRGS